MVARPLQPINRLISATSGTFCGRVCETKADIFKRMLGKFVVVFVVRESSILRQNMVFYQHLLLAIALNMFPQALKFPTWFVAAIRCSCCFNPGLWIKLAATVNWQLHISYPQVFPKLQLELGVTRQRT